ncbi:MAG: DUF951 domain-containing protein [Bacillota bacterium]|nr:DUF951 domain-containing protein [Bacillota bacterium]
MPLVFEVGDKVTLKKPHPCGSKDFEIVRMGADFRIKCLGCDKELWLSRRKLERRTRKIFRNGIRLKKVDIEKE